MRLKINRILKNFPLLFKIWDSSLRVIDTFYYKKHCSDYTVIPFGNYCMSRFITTASRLKPRKYFGEKTCPFDLLFCLDFEANTELFDTHFEKFYDGIEFDKKTQNWVNKKYNITFIHDRDITLEQLKERYDARIKNLYDYVNDKTKHLYFVTAISSNIEKVVSFNKKELSFIDEEKIHRKDGKQKHQTRTIIDEEK